MPQSFDDIHWRPWRKPSPDDFHAFSGQGSLKPNHGETVDNIWFDFSLSDISGLNEKNHTIDLTF